MRVQLPDDVVAVGYKETREFHYEQVFRSPSTGFMGTEQEFVDAGLAYAYIPVGVGVRRVTERGGA